MYTQQENGQKPEEAVDTLLEWLIAVRSLINIRISKHQTPTNTSCTKATTIFKDPDGSETYAQFMRNIWKSYDHPQFFGEVFISIRYKFVFSLYMFRFVLGLDIVMFIDFPRLLYLFTTLSKA